MAACSRSRVPALASGLNPTSSLVPMRRCEYRNCRLCPKHVHPLKGTPVACLACCRIIIERPHEIGVAVGEVHRPAIRTPGEPVRAADAVDDLVSREIGVEAPQRSDLGRSLAGCFEHRAGKEAALA